MEMNAMDMEKTEKMFQFHPSDISLLVKEFFFTQIFFFPKLTLLTFNKKKVQMITQTKYLINAINIEIVRSDMIQVLLIFLISR